MIRKITRRNFLEDSKKASFALASGITLLSNAQSVRAAPANDKIRLGLIGCGGRGLHLAQGFLQRGDCAFSALQSETALGKLPGSS